jgi:formylglycine-generating enzyme required for sulfatase activity
MEGMVLLSGGEFSMGSEAFYPEERPVRRVAVEGFWIDERPVSVADYRRFVKATGHVTMAERRLDADTPPGALVFRPTPGPVDLTDFHNWWAYVPGATWERPEGPASDTYTRGRHPVTQVAYEDAQAYAAWAGKALPTEAEWEYAARGGLDGAVFAWGDEFSPGLANTWEGEFPWQRLNGRAGTTPAASFPANGHGLYDMTGNVWEWTCDEPSADGTAQRPRCAPSDAGEHAPRRVIKGGSHLCAPNYCLRYRPAARQFEAVDTSTSHIGFRCVSRPDAR